MYPQDNKREHEEMSAAIALRAARITPLEEAMDNPAVVEREIVEELVETVPTTIGGVLALLRFQRDYSEGNDFLDGDLAASLMESVETGLLDLQDGRHVWKLAQATRPGVAGQLPENTSDANAVIRELQHLVDTWLHPAEVSAPSRVFSLVRDKDWKPPPHTPARVQQCTRAVSHINARLFATRPDLPEKIIDALARDKSSEKISTLFDYLFVPASGEAFGAEHYFAGYRVMRPEEIDLAVGASTPVRCSSVLIETSVRRENPPGITDPA